MPQTRPIVRVCIGVPSYQGPHRHCFTMQWEFLFYLGRLQERSYIQAAYPDYLSRVPPLDPSGEDPDCELRPEEPQFQFYLAEIVGYSLVGLARDQIVNRALANNCDYLLFFDDDMVFNKSTFLKLWRHQVDFVGALAFTSREPICPVLYRFHSRWNEAKLVEEIWSEPVFDYQPDQLQRVDGIGSGVILVSTEVFKRMKSPWFHGSMPSLGEDVYFSLRCKQAGILVHCDTSAKTLHVPNEPQIWMDEKRYLERKEMTRSWWKAEREPFRARS